MDIEYWNDLKVRIEKKFFSKINYEKVFIFVIVGIIFYSIAMLILFIILDINVFTSETIPIYVNPVFLIIISFIALFIYVTNKIVKEEK